jgi:class 3 adenylate cyclase/tetratricopeptide (TPR) repeat protein
LTRPPRGASLGAFGGGPGVQCPRCRHENRPQAKFCEECGGPLARACPNCGTQVSAAAKFCSECAHPLAEPVAQPRFASPQAYTPRHLAEKILTSRSALEGERKQVTVLFADLKGSMELLADRDPEEARKLLDPVLERMMEAVHRYEGTVNQVMGDGIMALFGAPVAHEDHAVRACYAALDMQAAIRRYGEEVRKTHGVKVAIRAGLNSGEVVVRGIGSDLRIDYTAVGQTTHLAARMEQLADPGTTLVTADTLRLVEGFVAVKPLGPVPVKGLEAPVEIYELTGAGPLRSRLHAAAARGLTRFVGRETELEQLRQTLSRAAAGHGQVVAIVGEPGVGKSRLVWEVTHSYRTHGWLVVQAGSVSYGKATPYLPVIDLLKTYFKIEDRDDPRVLREKIMGKLLALDRALEPSLPAFLGLLDVPGEDAQWQALDPRQRRQRTFDAVNRLLFRESQVQPLLLVFEDLHWIDTETQALLDRAIESLPTARVLLLVNYRPEYRHGWGHKSYYLQLRIDPLPPESAGELFTALLGEDRALEPLKRMLVERTEGNPFFLEESVQTLIETKVLIGSRGACHLAQPVEQIRVPATVQAVLAARIDRLTPTEKRLLQAAAVVGKDVPYPILAAIADEPEGVLRPSLAHLQATEFLYETSLYPEPEYTFKHALTHEVAYGSLLQERRRDLHGRIVEAIEQLYPDRLGEHVDRLADHAFRGEAWEKAVAYVRQAGAKSLTRSAFRETTTYFTQALTALAHRPPDRGTLEQAIDLRLEVRNAFVALGQLAENLGQLREAQALAETLGDRHRLCWVLAYSTSQLWLMGQHDEAVETGRRALAIASESDDLELQSTARGYLGVAYHALGDYSRAIECLEWLVGSLQDDRIGVPRVGLGLVSVTSRAWLIWCLSETGRFAEALEHGQEALRIAEAANHPASLVFACRSVGLALLRKGGVDRAVPALERAVEVCRTAHLRAPFDVAAAFLGYAYALGGRVAEAIPLMEQAVLDPASTGSANHPLFLAHLGEGHLLAGYSDRAIAVAQRALDLAHRQKERGNEAWVFRLLGEIAAQAGPPDLESAQEYYRQALARADELGMRPLMAHCHLGLGKLCRRTGDDAKAEEYLTTATTMYREMDMGFWLAQVDTVSSHP